MENDLKDPIIEVSVQEIEELEHDKALWGPGEWQDEPDQEEFVYKGIKCLLWRNKSGAWCGYIYVPKNTIPKIDGEIEEFFDVHGGITYQAEQHDGSLMIGFDCAHFGDKSPRAEFILSTIEDEPLNHNRASKRLDEILAPFIARMPPETYKNIEFARNECIHMVDQLYEVL